MGAPYANPGGNIDAGESYVIFSPTPPPPIPGDINGDQIVDITDLLAVLGAWGPCPKPCSPTCAADFDGNCTVDVTDLLTLLGNWS